MQFEGETASEKNTRRQKVRDEKANQLLNWHKWFAWYPVIMYNEVGQKEKYYYETKDIRWFEVVLRRFDLKYNHPVFKPIKEKRK